MLPAHRAAAALGLPRHRRAWPPPLLPLSRRSARTAWHACGAACWSRAVKTCPIPFWSSSPAHQQPHHDQAVLQLQESTRRTAASDGQPAQRRQLRSCPRASLRPPRPPAAVLISAAAARRGGGGASARATGGRRRPLGHETRGAWRATAAPPARATPRAGTQGTGALSGATLFVLIRSMPGAAPQK